MDLIDRQSVLKAIDDYERLSAVSQTVRNMTSLREIVQWLPAAQPEREKGEWLADEFDEWYCCSVCHKGLTMFDGTYDFCPHCGADMRGEQE